MYGTVRIFAFQMIFHLKNIKLIFLKVFLYVFGILISKIKKFQINIFFNLKILFKNTRKSYQTHFV
jgi:hypothetical protein